MKSELQKLWCSKYLVPIVLEFSVQWVPKSGPSRFRMVENRAVLKWSGFWMLSLNGMDQFSKGLLPSCFFQKLLKPDRLQSDHSKSRQMIFNRLFTIQTQSSKCLEFEGSYFGPPCTFLSVIQIPGAHKPDQKSAHNLELLCLVSQW